MLAMQAAFLSVMVGRPADAERWTDMADRWQDQAAGPDDLHAEAMAAALRATMCRRGVEHMRADADEAARKLRRKLRGATGPVPARDRARPVGDLDGGDASLAEAVSQSEDVGAPEALASALCERALVAMARNQWDRAEAFAGRAGAVLRRAGIEDIYVTPLVCAVQARAALHRGDVPAVRRELVTAQRLRHLLTYALPHVAVQARIELTRVPTRASRPGRGQDADGGDR